MKKVEDLNLPNDRCYTDEHVWIMPSDGDYIIGISDYAQDQLGEVAYVDLPAKGKNLAGHDEFGSIESVKAVNALFMPVAGEVIEINDALDGAPETVNVDCYGDGWLARIKVDNPSDIDKLMDAQSYRKILK